MYTINETIKNEIIIKNSKFIGIVYSINSEDQVKNILNTLRNDYDDATHIAYAWKLENKQKYNDDGEPSGTAGAPIMEIINKNDLINVLIVVVRFFGGIKLGAGGLIRAYSKAAREVIKLTDFKEYVKYNYYKLSASYDDLKLLNQLTNSFEIESKSFDEDISYLVKVNEKEDNLKEIIKNTSIHIEEL